MKKKKLKQRIAELEKERDREKFNAQEWEDIYIQCIEELKKHGVKVKIVYAEDVDRELGYMIGTTTEPLTLEFDFSEHDDKIKLKTGMEFFDMAKKDLESFPAEYSKRLKFARRIWG